MQFFSAELLLQRLLPRERPRGFSFVDLPAACATPRIDL